MKSITKYCNHGVLNFSRAREVTKFINIQTAVEPLFLFTQKTLKLVL